MAGWRFAYPNSQGGDFPCTEIGVAAGANGVTVTLYSMGFYLSAPHLTCGYSASMPA